MRSRVLLLLLATLFVVPLWAQVPTGTLTGRVTDGTDPLPGVNVTASGPALQGKRVAVTSANGDYIFALLPPGQYQVVYELQGFASGEASVKVSAAQATTHDMVLRLGGFAEEITVTAEQELISSSTQASVTMEQNLVEELPVARDMLNSVQLAPGVLATGPRNETSNTYGLSISGAQSWESLFMVDGVVVNENIRGQALPLFIEDAIQETTVSTGGVSAEYGRFAGGVINTLTKSGGNTLSGSLRVSLANDDWTAGTPLTVEKTDQINDTYEATLGGAILKDRLWYFVAGRTRELTQSSQTARTDIPFDLVDEQDRVEAKLTLSPSVGHRIVASYIDIDQATDNNFFTSVMDLDSLDDRETPQDLFAAHYTGILNDSFFIEAQYSKRQFTFVGSGADTRDLIEGTVLLDQQTGFTYNSPAFCGVCGDEQRDNQNYLLKASWFVSSPSWGSHDLVFGLDRYEDKLLNNNHQSGSDWHLWGTSTIVRGSEVYPQFLPGFSTWLIYWPILEASQGNNFRTDSAFINDRWRLNNNWSFNVGLRFDKNHGVNSLGQTVSDDSKLSPRVGITFDPKGDGDWVINASYGKYVTSLAQNAGDSSSAGGVPAIFAWFYQGPAINPDPNAASLIGKYEAIQMAFDWFEANGGVEGNPWLFFVDIPGLTTVIEDSLRSPSADELTVGFTKRFGAKALLRADYIHREFHDLYATRIDTGTGQVTDEFGQVFDRRLVVNDDDALRRKYDALQTQFAYRPSDRLNLGGNYTLSHTYGTFDGENSGTGPLQADYLEYPEYRDLSWYAPSGNLGADQRHKVRLWAVWNAIQTQHHRLSASILQSYFSGTPYGALGAVDVSSVANPGYAVPPSTNQYWFTGRDAFRTDDITSTDLALNYSFSFPALGADVEVFLQPEVLNVFNEDGVVFVDTTVLDATNDPDLQSFDPFTETPVEGVHWRKGSSFGKPVQEIDYQNPRTFRFSVGFRF